MPPALVSDNLTRVPGNIPRACNNKIHYTGLHCASPIRPFAEA